MKTKMIYFILSSLIASSALAECLYLRKVGSNDFLQQSCFGISANEPIAKLKELSKDLKKGLCIDWDEELDPELFGRAELCHNGKY